MFDLFKTSAYLSALITTVVISLWYLVAKPAVLLVFSYRGVIGLTCLVTTRIPKWLLLNRPYRQQSLSSQTQEGAYWERWSWHTGLHLFSVLQLEVVTDNVFFFLFSDHLGGVCECGVCFNTLYNEIFWVSSLIVWCVAFSCHQCLSSGGFKGGGGAVI